MSDRKKKAEVVAKALATAAAAAGKAAVDQKTPGQLGAAVALAMLPLVVEQCLPGFLRRKQGAIEEWWIHVVYDETSDQGIAAEIRAKTDDPAFQDVIAAAYRSVMDATSRAVIPALAMLTREYVRTGRSPDHFLRGLGELLSYVSAEEYQDLKRMFGWIVATVPGEAVWVTVGLLGPSGKELAYRWSLLPREMSDDGAHIFFPQADADWRRADFELPSGRRLFQLLKVHALAAEGRTPGDTGPDYFSAEPSMIKRIAALLV